MFFLAKKNLTRFDKGNLNAGDLWLFMKRGPESTFLSEFISYTRTHNMEGSRASPAPALPHADRRARTDRAGEP